MENKEKKFNKKFNFKRNKKHKTHTKAKKKPVNTRVYGLCRQLGISCFYAFVDGTIYFWIPVRSIDAEDDKLQVATFSAKDDKIEFNKIEGFLIYNQHTDFSDMVKWLINDGIKSYKGFEYNYGRKKLFYENIENFVEIINK